MSQPSPMTPAGLANTIAAARARCNCSPGQRQVSHFTDCTYKTAWLKLSGRGFTLFDPRGIRAAERYLALWQALTSLTDWRVDKAIEHLSDLRQVAVEAGLSDDKVALVDRYTGWFINAQEKRQALAQAAEKLQEALDG